MWFLILCLIFIFFYYIFPSLLKWWVKWFVHRQTRRMQDNMYRAAGIDPDEMRRRQAEAEAAEAREADRRKNGGWSEPKKRSKKIASDVGEYVKFKEVETTTETAAATHYESESQIEDVQWEDIDSK